MARPPEFNKHAELITDYIRRLGLFGLTQEIRFSINEVLSDDIDNIELLVKVTKALEKFQADLTKIQKERIASRLTREFDNSTVYPIGVKRAG